MKEKCSDYQVINVRKFTKPIKVVQKPTENEVKFINSAPQRCSNCQCSRSQNVLNVVINLSPVYALNNYLLISVGTAMGRIVLALKTVNTADKQQIYNLTLTLYTAVHCGLRYAAAARLHHNTKHVQSITTNSDNTATQSLQSSNTF